MTAIVSALTFFLRSDLVSRPHWEDGSPVYSLVWYVVAEAADGRRWAHDHTFDGPTVGCSTRDVVPERAARFLARVEAAAPDHVDGSDHWFRLDAAYGSEAYVREGTEAERAFREREDYDLGLC